MSLNGNLILIIIGMIIVNIGAYREIMAIKKQETPLRIMSEKSHISEEHVSKVFYYSDGSSKELFYKIIDGKLTVTRSTFSPGSKDKKI